jgi:hypothetical protein
VEDFDLWKVDRRRINSLNLLSCVCWHVYAERLAIAGSKQFIGRKAFADQLTSRCAGSGEAGRLFYVRNRNLSATLSLKGNRAYSARNLPSSDSDQ